MRRNNFVIILFESSIACEIPSVEDLIKLRGSWYMELLKSFFRIKNEIYFKNDVTHVTFTISH